MREIGGQPIYYNWKQAHEGLEIKGKYVKTRIDDYNKLNWILRDSEGQEHVLNNAGSLARKMGMCNFGDHLLIRYEGTEVVKLKKYGSKDVHQFKVFNTKDAESSVDDGEDEEEDELDILGLDDVADDDDDEDEDEDDSNDDDGMDLDFDLDDLDA